MNKSEQECLNEAISKAMIYQSLLEMSTIKIEKLKRLLAEACEKLSDICFQYDQSALNSCSEELKQWFEEHKKEKQNDI